MSPIERSAGGGSTGSSGIPVDGWVADTNTPTFASASTFTAGTTDLTATYQKGTRIKFTQTTVKYFVVVGSSFGGGTTTVTIAVTPDYTLANAAITSPFYSYIVSPQGWPTWFNWTPSYTGFSVNPTPQPAIFRVEGTSCTVNYRDVNGTSNAAGFTFSAPVACSSFVAGAFYVSVSIVQDGGLTQSSPGDAFIQAGGSTITIQKTLPGGGFAAAGTKSVQGVVLVYPI